jgi:hypothetical protein
MSALLENDWFDVAALFVVFAIPSIFGVALVARDTRRSIREGRITIGDRSGKDTTYEKDPDPVRFWGAIGFKVGMAVLFLSLPLLCFFLMAWPHYRSILACWNAV